MTDPTPDQQTDTWVVRIVVTALAAIVLAVVVAAAVLANLDRTLPGEVISIGAGGAGALAAVLASTRSRS
jgi:anti-sigma-K factor RskA